MDVAAAFAWPALGRITGPLAAAALAALAMAGADGPLVVLGLTEPGEWTAADWASDILPHARYGAAADATPAALETGRVRNG